MTIEVVFPFFVEGKQRKSSIPGEVVREREYVSFSLPFATEVAVPEAISVTSKPLDGTPGAIYIAEFPDIDAAMEFTDAPSVTVGFLAAYPDPRKLEQEANEYVARHSAAGTKSKKRRR